jgi:hypothetical protein
LAKTFDQHFPVDAELPEHRWVDRFAFEQAFEQLAETLAA